MINIKERFGDRWRVTLDESADVDTDHATRLWCYRIQCLHGFISVHGPETLAAFTAGTVVGKRLMTLPGVTLHQRGDREVRVTFPVECIDAVAELLRARKKRHLSEADRARLVEAGKPTRLSRATASEIDAPCNPPAKSDVDHVEVSADRSWRPGRAFFMGVQDGDRRRRTGPRPAHDLRRRRRVPRRLDPDRAGPRPARRDPPLPDRLPRPLHPESGNPSVRT